MEGFTKGNKETLGSDGCVHCLDGGDRLFSKDRTMSRKQKNKQKKKTTRHPFKILKSFILIPSDPKSFLSICKP